MLLLIKLFDYPVQRLNLHHRALVCLLVVGVERVVAAMQYHRTFSGAEPYEVELREGLDDAPEHLRPDVALAGVYIVDNIPCR